MWEAEHRNFTFKNQKMHTEKRKLKQQRFGVFLLAFFHQHKTIHTLHAGWVFLKWVWTTTPVLSLLKHSSFVAIVDQILLLLQQQNRLITTRSIIHYNDRTVMAGSHYISGGYKSRILLPMKRALSQSEQAAEAEMCSQGMWVFCRNTSVTWQCSPERRALGDMAQKWKLFSCNMLYNRKWKCLKEENFSFAGGRGIMITS